jgi:transcriptional regulator with XRE-family HTH domain
MLTLYANIKFYRGLRGYSQDELARKVGYSNRSAIARIENGEIDLPQSKILAFAEALNVTPGQLMGSEGTTKYTETGTRILTAHDKLDIFLCRLNDAGIEKLTERAAELTEIPRYRKEDN